MDYYEYTERQKQIISGEYPITRITNHELNRLMAKAMYKFDASVVNMVTNELTLRSVRISHYTGPYSKRQEALISGEIPIEKASMQELKVAYKVSRSLCDKEGSAVIEKELRKRGPLLTDINGYSAAQTMLILGLNPIDKAQDGAVTALANMAEYLCDLDVAEFANAEEDRRGLKKRRMNKRTLGFEDILLETEIFKHANDLALCQAAFDAYRTESPLIDIIEDEVEERVLKLHRKYYTQREIDLINGQASLDDESLAKLEYLYMKLKYDNLDQKLEFFKMLEEKYHKRQEAWEKRKKEMLDFTDRQLSIILGEIPTNTVRIKELKTIANKAEKLGKDDIAEHFRKIIEDREKIIDSESEYDDVQQLIINSLKGYTPSDKITVTGKEIKKGPAKKCSQSLSQSVKHLRDEEYYKGLEYSPYTKYELQIINGEVNLAAVTRKKLGILIRKARKYGDNDAADRIEEYLAERETFNPSDEEGVITGELPYEEIPVRLLKGLLKKAKASGDIKLKDLCEKLIYEKNSDAQTRKTNGPSRKGEYERRTRTKEWAMKVLQCRVSREDCTMADLQDIRLYASTLEDPVYKEIAEFFIAARIDPSVVYTVQTGEEAEALIQKHTHMPINWPR